MGTQIRRRVLGVLAGTALAAAAAAVVPGAAHAVGSCPAGEPQVVVHAASLPDGSQAVCLSDITSQADLGTLTYHLQQQDGTTQDVDSSEHTLSVHALLAYVLGTDAADARWTTTPRDTTDDTAGDALLYRDELLATDDPDYAYGDQPPPALFFDGTDLVYVRSPTRGTDVNADDRLAFGPDQTLDLDVQTTDEPALQPVLHADRTKVASGGSVAFTVSMDHPPAGKLGYAWEYGDGTTSSTTDPVDAVTHSYPKDGGRYLAHVVVAAADHPPSQSADVPIRVGKPPKETTPQGDPGTTGTTQPPASTGTTGTTGSTGTTGGTGTVPTNPLTLDPPAATPPTSGTTGTTPPPATTQPQVPQTPVTTPQQPSTSVVDTLPVVQGQLVGGTEPLSLAGGPLQARTSARAESADTKLPGSQVPLVVGGVLVLLGAGALTETGLPRSVTVAARRVQRLRRWRRGPAKIRP